MLEVIRSDVLRGAFGVFGVSKKTNKWVGLKKETGLRKVGGFKGYICIIYIYIYMYNIYIYVIYIFIYI